MAGPPEPGLPSSAVDGPFASNPPPTISALLASLAAESAAAAASAARTSDETTSRTTAAPTTAAPTTPETTAAPSSFSTSTARPASSAAITSSPTTTSTGSTLAAASTNLSFPPSAQATNASANPASTTGIPATFTKQEACKGMSCSPGLQAAVAVPVILVTLAAIAFFFLLCARRRKRRPESPEPEAGSRTESRRRGGGWARHLRIFSFDTELLVGGRSSASNSVREGATSQQDHRSVRSVRSVQHSVRSLQSAAPAYRDALSSAQPPILVAPMTQVPRPNSQATAPPPYYGGAAGSRPQTAQTDHTTRSDPFADPDPEDDAVSPIEGPLLSPASGEYHDGQDESFSTDSTPVASREPSIREAQMARRMSVGSVTRNGSRGK